MLKYGFVSEHVVFIIKILIFSLRVVTEGYYFFGIVTIKPSLPLKCNTYYVNEFSQNCILNGKIKKN